MRTASPQFRGTTRLFDVLVVCGQIRGQIRPAATADFPKQIDDAPLAAALGGGPL